MRLVGKGNVGIGNDSNGTDRAGIGETEGTGWYIEANGECGSPHANEPWLVISNADKHGSLQLRRLVE